MTKAKPRREGYKRLTPKQEAFCQTLLTNDDNATAAYRIAYPASRDWTPQAVWSNSCVLRNSRKVMTRLDELQAAARKHSEATIDDYLIELETLKITALASGNVGAAVKAGELKGKVLGMFVDRIQTVNDDPKALLDGLKTALLAMPNGHVMYQQLALALGVDVAENRGDSLALGDSDRETGRAKDS